AVAHQDELRVDSLRKERFCEGFVEFGHGAVPLNYEVIWHATSMPGDAPSIQLNRPHKNHAATAGMSKKCDAFRNGMNDRVRSIPEPGLRACMSASNNTSLIYRTNSPQEVSRSRGSVD